MADAKRTAFVLAGGGAAGSYQFGCLKAIYEKSNYRPDFITANSAGALNAAGLSYAGIGPLEALWRGIQSRHDIFGDRFFGYFALLSAQSLWVSDPLRKKLDSFMVGKKPQIPFWVNYTNLQNGQLCQAHSSDPDFYDKVLASASLPVLTEPVGGIYVDGGIRNNTPIGFAIDQGAERLFVFINSSKDEANRLPFISNFPGAKSIAMRTLDIMSDSMFWNDIKVAQTYNDMGKGKYVEITWFAPSKTTIDTLDFNSEAIAGAIQQGYDETLLTLATVP